MEATLPHSISTRRRGSCSFPFREANAMAVFTPLVGFGKPLTEEVLQTDNRVTTCYSVFDAFFPRIGLHDLTEGIYESPQTSHEEAQAKQHTYLLDQLC